MTENYTNFHDFRLARLRFLSLATFQSLGRNLDTNKKLITDGIKTKDVTVMAYLADSRSLKFSLKMSIIQPKNFISVQQNDLESLILCHLKKVRKYFVSIFFEFLCT